jgi:phage shock protein E
MKKLNRLTLRICLLAFALSKATLSYAAETNAPAKSTQPAKATQLVDANEAAKLIADKKVVLLDVRTADEFADGHIAGATNIASHKPDFKEQLEKLDKNQSYLVYCAGGFRSAKSCKVMNELNFKSLYDLKGGIHAWQEAGKPVEK